MAKLCLFQFGFLFLFSPHKQHTSLVGGSNPSCCPLCQKVCVSGEDLMEHMKYVHKDPNASGVPGNQFTTITNFQVFAFLHHFFIAYLGCKKSIFSATKESFKNDART